VRYRSPSTGSFDGVGMTAKLVTEALMMAVWRRGRLRELLQHSDRGSRDTSENCQPLMAEHGIQCSLSHSGSVWDNAAMESFFSTLKTERTTGIPHPRWSRMTAEVCEANMPSHGRSVCRAVHCLGGSACPSHSTNDQF